MYSTVHTHSNQNVSKKTRRARRDKTSARAPRRATPRLVSAAAAAAAVVLCSSSSSGSSSSINSIRAIGAAPAGDVMRTGSQNVSVCLQLQLSTALHRRAALTSGFRVPRAIKLSRLVSPSRLLLPSIVSRRRRQSCHRHVMSCGATAAVQYIAFHVHCTSVTTLLQKLKKQQRKSREERSDAAAVAVLRVESSRSDPNRSDRTRCALKTAECLPSAESTGDKEEQIGTISANCEPIDSESLHSDYNRVNRVNRRAESVRM